MKIGGHALREHIRLLAPLFGLIAAVWALRLVLVAAGAPPGLVRVCSVTVTGAVSVLLAALLIHFRRFGSYSNIVVAAFLLQCWQQLLIVGAIAFSVFANINNVYSAPEYSPHGGPLGHIAGHLTFGLGMGTLFGAGTGCLLLWMLKRLVPVNPAKSAIISGL